jgi:hypothetical protein
MTYQKKNDMCVHCGKQLSKGKQKYCINCTLRPTRYIPYAKRGVFEGQCKQYVNSRHGVFKCPNQGLNHRDGMCDDCFNWNLKRQGIYPHKDNATRCIEVYLVL